MFRLLFIMVAIGLHSFPLWAETSTQTESDVHKDEQVMHAFTSQEVESSDIIKIDDQKKRLIMFILGVPLLVLILATGALGVAMGVYGKQVFVAHLVCAGLSMTLALAHAIVGLVWFYPF